jgi:hypothetical protein
VTCDLAIAMGKTITLSKDMPGFIANRLLMPYINEAIQLLHEVRDRVTCLRLGLVFLSYHCVRILVLENILI